METCSPKERTSALLLEIEDAGLKIATVARCAGVGYRRLYDGAGLTEAEIQRVSAAIALLRAPK